MHRTVAGYTAPVQADSLTQWVSTHGHHVFSESPCHTLGRSVTDGLLGIVTQDYLGLNCRFICPSSRSSVHSLDMALVGIYVAWDTSVCETLILVSKFCTLIALSSLRRAMTALPAHEWTSTRLLLHTSRSTLHYLASSHLCICDVWFVLLRNSAGTCVFCAYFVSVQLQTSVYDVMKAPE